jgi:hypothetical protein
VEGGAYIDLGDALKTHSKDLVNGARLTDFTSNRTQCSLTRDR